MDHNAKRKVLDELDERTIVILHEVYFKLSGNKGKGNEVDNELSSNNKRKSSKQQEKQEIPSIPSILIDCVEVIETKGINEVGIYRVSDVITEVQRMKELYTKNPKKAQVELREKSPHLATNLLKLYLRELEEPLFTSDLCPAFISSANLSEDSREECICKLFNELVPEPNKSIIMFLLNHLLNIVNNSQKNMMTVHNLATIFGPILLSQNDDQIEEQNDMSKILKENSQKIFVISYILNLHSNNRLLQF